MYGTFNTNTWAARDYDNFALDGEGASSGEDDETDEGPDDELSVIRMKTRPHGKAQ